MTINIYLKNSSSNNVSIEYLIPGILASTAHQMSNSHFSINEFENVKFIIYGGLIANMSKERKSAFEIIKQASLTIEKTNDLCNSKIASNITIENNVRKLSINKNMLLHFDYWNIFPGYLRSEEMTDIGVYLDIYDGRDKLNIMFDHHILILENPVLNIITVSNPISVIRMLKQDRFYDLNNRYLMCIPRLIDNTNCAKIKHKPKVSILCILYAINLIFGKEKAFFRFDSLFFRFNSLAKHEYEIMVKNIKKIRELANAIGEQNIR